MSDWISKHEAAEVLGRHPDTVCKMARGDAALPDGVAEIAHNGGRGPHSLWRIVWADDTESGASPEDDRDRSSERGPSGFVERDGYVYDRDRDLYIISVPSMRGPYMGQGDFVRALRRKYTGGATVAECAREFEIARQTMVELLHALAITHSSGQFTDEEVESRAEEDLVRDEIQAKRKKVELAAERADWRRIKRDAAQVGRIRQIVAGALAEVEFDHPVIPKIKAPHKRCAVVVGCSDWHIGKRSAGKDHTLADQVAEIERHIDAVVASATQTWGAPERFILAMAGDLLHADTMGQTTTRGTPQGPQSVGSQRMALREAIRLPARLADRLATVAPVEIHVVPGNHDEYGATAAGLAWCERYRGSKRVSVVMPEASCRRVVAHEDVPILITHGDKEPTRDLPLILAREMPAGCRLDHGLVIHGHLHRNSRALEGDRKGVQVVCLRSPASPDDWLAEKGYIGSQRGSTLLRVEPGRGLGGVEYVRG